MEKKMRSINFKNIILKIISLDDINLKDFMLIITLSFAFCSYNTNIIPYILMSIWVLFAIIKISMDRFHFSHEMKNINSIFLKYNFGSRVLIYLYTLFLILFGLTESRFLSSNLQTFINGVSALSVIYLYGERGIKCSFIALINSWILSIISLVIKNGIPYAFKNLEFHDIAFAAGYIIIYYIFIQKKCDKRERILITFITMIILLAFKRIGIFALIVSIFIGKILERIDDEKVKKKIILIISGCICLCFYLYIYLILNGSIWDIFAKFNINVMGRNYYYDVIAKFSKFDFRFLGLGRNSCATLMSNDYSYLRVGNIHSDILRMYVENGFIVFTIWLYTFFYLMPKKMEEKYGYKIMEMFFLCTIYTYIVYLTDNTELYLVTQYFYILIPCYAILVHNKKIKFKGEKNE